MIVFFTLCLIIPSLIIFVIGVLKYRQAAAIKLEKIEQQKQLNLQIEQLECEINGLLEERQKVQKELVLLSNKQWKLSNDIVNIQEQTNNLAKKEKIRLTEQVELYKQNLNCIYEEEKIKHTKRIAEINAEVEEVNAELQKIKETLKASLEARIREKQIKEKLSFYCIQISDSDKRDIQKLESLKKELNKPRVLSMLIWQTWFQKPLKSLAANVLGTTTKTGIYKITNIDSGECYIGQAVDIATRWNEHAKCGLGIDTPANNKLYKAMQENGLWMFSWELLEECSKEQLNEKEKYYINAYNSYEFGYNSTSGNK